MARATTKTLLPLDTFAKIMGMHPLHFNGVEVHDLAPATTCGQPIMQYAWQAANAISREDIAIAIAEAESTIAQYTRFKLLPTFEADERKSWPHPWSPELFGSSMLNARGQPSAVKVRWGNLIAGGVRGSAPISLAAPIVYTDTDGDGYFETATVAVSTTVTDPNEIALYYPGEGGDEAWEIRPIRVTIAGGVATIRFRREQAVNPGFLEGFSGRAVDGLNDSAFLASADVYRLYHDPQQQVQFLWENAGSNCGCSLGGCVVCYMATQFGCSTVKDYRVGLISATPANWNATTQLYEPTSPFVPRAPDRVRLWYRAGWRDQSLARPFVDMDPRWARAVAYLATALLSRPMCQCQNVTAAVEFWQDDLAKIKVGQSASENFQLDKSRLLNPFGTTRGALHAWDVFRNESIGEAVEL